MKKRMFIFILFLINSPIVCMEQQKVRKKGLEILAQKAIEVGDFEGIKNIINKKRTLVYYSYKECGDRTLLHLACKSKKPNDNIIRFLISENSRSDAKTQFYYTPIEDLIYNKKASFAIVRYLHFVGNKEQLAHRVKIDFNQIGNFEIKEYFKNYYDLRLIDDPGSSIFFQIGLGNAKIIKYIMSRVIGAILYKGIAAVRDTEFYSFYQYIKSQNKQEVKKIIETMSQILQIDAEIIDFRKSCNDLVRDILRNIIPEGLLVEADIAYDKFEEKKQKEFLVIKKFYENYCKNQDLGMPGKFIEQKMKLGTEIKSDIILLMRMIIARIIFSQEKGDSIYKSPLYEIYQISGEKIKNYNKEAVYVTDAMSDALAIPSQVVDLHKEFKEFVYYILFNVKPEGELIGAKLACQILNTSSTKKE